VVKIIGGDKSRQTDKQQTDRQTDKSNKQDGQISGSMVISIEIQTKLIT